MLKATVAMGCPVGTPRRRHAWPPSSPVSMGRATWHSRSHSAGLDLARRPSHHRHPRELAEHRPDRRACVERDGVGVRVDVASQDVQPARAWVGTLPAMQTHEGGEVGHGVRPAKAAAIGVETIPQGRLERLGQDPGDHRVDHQVEGLVHEHQATPARHPDLAQGRVTDAVLPGRDAAGQHPGHAAPVQRQARQADAVLCQRELSATAEVPLVEPVDGHLVATVVGEGSGQPRPGVGASSAQPVGEQDVPRVGTPCLRAGCRPRRCPRPGSGCSPCSPR